MNRDVRSSSASPASSTTAVATSPADTAAALPDDPALLKRMIAELLTTLHETRQDYEQVCQRLDQLLRKLYGPKGESWNPEQLALFPEMQPGADAPTDPSDSQPSPEPPTPPADEAPVTKTRKKGHGRNGLPKNLRRDRREHQLAEAERLCPCCQKLRVKIGEEVSEQLEYVPASLFVIEHARFKYACPHCVAQAQPAQIVTAPKPDALFAKGLPGAGLVAQVIVSKYSDHLPLHRQERIFARHGVELSRQTMCDWMAASAEILQPLHDLMVSLVLTSRVLHTDDTHVPVQDEQRQTTRKATLWVYLGDRDHAYNVFAYTPSRARDGPKTFLGKYQGYLQADAFSGYDAIYTNGQVHEVACWAHARRKFYEARTSDAALSHEALARIGRLYDIERAAKERIIAEKLDSVANGPAADALRLALRQEKSVAELTSLRHWLDTLHAQALPKSPIGQAVAYALNQWDALLRYTSAGFLAIDNNAAERALRAIAIGRKNWLFCGSDKGGHTAAVLFTFTSTCQRHGLDPFAYLRDVLSRLARGPLPAEQLATLLPDRWQPPPPAQASAPAAPPNPAP
jgi:transposase